MRKMNSAMQTALLMATAIMPSSGPGLAGYQDASNIVEKPPEVVPQEVQDERVAAAQAKRQRKAAQRLKQK